MAVKERTLTQEIAWRLAEVYAAQTHGNYDEETLFDRGGDWAADEVGKVLFERLGVPTEALEAGVVQELIKAATRYAATTSDKVALITGPYRYGPYEYLYVNAQRIVACVNACEGIPTEALEAGVIRDLINAATRYLRVMTRDTDEEHAEAHLREVLAKVRGEA